MLRSSTLGASRLDDQTRKRALLEEHLYHHPDVGPAWKMLAGCARSEDEHLAAVRRGLAARCDAETLGILRINLAQHLYRRGDTPAGLKLLTDVALDPDSTVMAEALAKSALQKLVGAQA